MTTDRIEIKCAKCGGATFRYPSDPKPEDTITCEGCGASMLYSEMEASAMKLAKEKVDALVIESLRGMKGWSKK